MAEAETQGKDKYPASQLSALFLLTVSPKISPNNQKILGNRIEKLLFISCMPISSKSAAFFFFCSILCLSSVLLEVSLKDDEVK